MHITLIRLTQLFVSPLNVRKTLDAGQEDVSLEELAANIHEKGLLSPLTVRPSPDDRYEVVVGQRRYRACQLIRLDPVPCLVKHGLSDAEAIALSLIENVHRADMHPIDKAKAFEALYNRYESHQRVAEEASCSVATIRKYLKLLELPQALQERVGTTEGPAGISALSRLATTFKGDDAITAFNEISGFTQRVQEEILKRSDGDVSRLPALVEEAQEGIFNLRQCGVSHGCVLMQDLIGQRVSEMEFRAMICRALQGVTPRADEIEMLEAARSFWRSLCGLRPESVP